MEHLSKEQSQKFENGPVTSWEYAMEDAHLNLAPITINGRYPESGFTSNLESDSIVHVISGQGSIASPDGYFRELKEDDQVHIAIGDAYYFEGTLKVLYAATPQWTPQQTKHVD